jgi:hypothetical protein
MTECGLSAPLSFDQSERCSLVNPNTGRVERSRRLASELSVNLSVNLSVKVSVGDQHLTRGADDAARLSRVGLDRVPGGDEGLRRHGGCQGRPRALHPRRLVAFCFTVGAPYFPMRDKLAQVQADCCCEFVDLVTPEEQLPSLYALLQYLMQVPKLDGETMPEFTDVPPCFRTSEAKKQRSREGGSPKFRGLLPLSCCT